IDEQRHGDAGNNGGVHALFPPFSTIGQWSARALLFPVPSLLRLACGDSAWNRLIKTEWIITESSKSFNYIPTFLRKRG
ncbi:MAG: hypothetical protein IJ234_07535, partial [Clostridia bacterium]|nr:hypothetical protein [Clostridia bacterium]